VPESNRAIVPAKSVELGIGDAQKMPAEAGSARLAPSPGTPGEDWGEGDFERRKHLVLEITLILPSSGVPGEGKN